MSIHEKRVLTTLLLLPVWLGLNAGLGDTQDDNAEIRRLHEELNARRGKAGADFETYRQTLSELLARKPKFSLSRWLSQFLTGRMNGRAGRSSFLGTMLLAVGVLTLIGVIVYFVSKIRQGVVGNVEEQISHASKDPPASAQSARAQADKFEADRDFREALRSLYLAILLHLHEHGFIHYDKSLTNREHLHRIKEDSELQEALRPAIRVFDDVWYGRKPADQETVMTYRSLLRKVYEATQ